MKFDPYMYHPNTFHLPENKGVNEWVAGGHIQKVTKTWNKIDNISPF